MKNSKKGISLIVLIITIVVIIILAAAVILTINKNNPIDSAKTAVKHSDLSEIQGAVTLYVTNYMARNLGDSPIAEAGATLGGTTTPVDNADGTVTGNKTIISWDDIGVNKSNLGTGWKVDKYGAVTAPADYLPAK